MATSKPPKTKFPYPYKPRRHEVSHAAAIRMRKRAIAVLGCDGIGRSAGYNREIFDKILSNPACVGIRFFPGINDDGEFTILFCAFDSKGNNILKGTIGDVPYHCPPFCPPVKDSILYF